jgi:hypothetical protein
MATKKAPATEPEAKVLEPELYDEATAFEKSAAKVDELPVPKLVNRLAQVRDALRRLDVDYKARIEKIATKLLPFATQRDRIKKAMEAAEKKFAARLTKIKADGGDLPSETDEGVKLTIVTTHGFELKQYLAWAAEGYDADDLRVLHAIDLSPDDGQRTVTKTAIKLKYIKPLAECIDWKAVEADKEKNELLVQAGEQPKYDLWFAKITDKLSLRTKLPEVEA